MLQVMSLVYLTENQRPFLYWYLYREQYKNFRLKVGEIAVMSVRILWRFPFWILLLLYTGRIVAGTRYE